MNTYDEDQHAERAPDSHDANVVKETAVRPPPLQDLPQSQPQDIRETIAYLEEEGAIEGEGVEQERLDSEDGGHIDEPFDPTEIKIVTKGPTVDLVMKRIREDEIDLQPDFQRSGDIWPTPTRSRLIESLLLRIPLPVFYMAADEDDKWQVVDGLQRLGALRDFVLDKTLRLRGLEYLNQFEGRSYDDLPRPMQRRINETQLSCHVIEHGTPHEVKFNVFKRINTEGRPLKLQEIRHALNPGPARDLLRELAESAEFLRATDRGVSPKRMADRECVLRFLAFRSLGVAAYAGKLDEFLLRAMRTLNDDTGQHRVLANDFRRAMSLASDIFGQEAFRKPRRLGFASRRSPVNKPLFECLSVALAKVGGDRTELLLSRRGEVVSGLSALMEDTQFVESISIGTQTTRMVKIRFGRIEGLIQEAAS